MSKKKTYNYGHEREDRFVPTSDPSLYVDGLSGKFFVVGDGATRTFLHTAGEAHTHASYLLDRPGQTSRRLLVVQVVGYVEPLTRKVVPNVAPTRFTPVR